MKLLRIDSSARVSSVTRKLTDTFAQSWRRQHPQGEVVERDLSLTPMPHITDDWNATFGASERLTPPQRDYLSTSDMLIAEISAADVIVIGAPMYNFMISWALKAWIDQIVRLGRTVAYGPTGPRGLLQGKKVVVITSRGGSYLPEPTARNFDLQEFYLRRVLCFIGLTDITFIHAEHQRRGEQAEQGFAAARARIDEVLSLQPAL